MTTKQHTPRWTEYVWLIYLLFFLAWPAMKRGTEPLEWLSVFIATVVFLVLYMQGLRTRGRGLLITVLGITVIGIAFLPINPGAGSFFIYAAAFAAEFRERRHAVLAIGIIELIVIAELLALRPNLYTVIWIPILVAMIGAMNVHNSQERRANERLRMAHEEIERLAQLAERERIARDLHDLLGHTLSLITLKSELAAKLADRDIDRAREEIRDVERISREALAQVREAVRGYRSEGLRREIDSSAAMLRTAGIETEISIEPVPLTPQQEAILSLAVREAITNVVRHANASRAVIEIATRDSDVVMTVSDNGRGGSERDGSGLTGMRERVASLGGSVRRAFADGTRLTVTFPIATTRQERPA